VRAFETWLFPSETLIDFSIAAENQATQFFGMCACPEILLAAGANVNATARKQQAVADDPRSILSTQ
jgi:hypothetical protein